MNCRSCSICVPAHCFHMFSCIFAPYFPQVTFLVLISTTPCLGSVKPICPMRCVRSHSAWRNAHNVHEEYVLQGLANPRPQQHPLVPHPPWVGAGLAPRGLPLGPQLCQEQALGLLPLLGGSAPWPKWGPLVSELLQLRLEQPLHLAVQFQVSYQPLTEYIYTHRI